MQPLLLDTHAAIWISRDEPLAEAAAARINEAKDAGGPVYVSPITAWEVGLLVARRRLTLLMTPQRWFARLLSVPGIQLAEMPPEILIAASFLPGSLPRDPADRILAATARDIGATLVTRDRALLQYGEQGYVSVLSC
jgi:PIN domain nuclease of toxin-antitoxin system